MNTSVYHDVPIIIQPQTWACWYSSFQMVVRYFRRLGQRSYLIDPSENAAAKAIYDANKGIGSTDPDERARIAVALGFTPYYASLTPEGMWNLLNDAPVIYAGAWPGQTSGHWIVVKGISDTELTINNPLIGTETYDYNYFMNQFLIQTQERPLITV
jgi:hypothetical protein